MRTSARVLACLAHALLLACGGAPPDLPPESVAAPTAAAPPEGNDRLGNDVAPTAYRLDLRIDPAQEHTRGTMEISVTLARPTREIRLHGENLTINEAWIEPARGAGGAGGARGARLRATAVHGPHGGLALRLTEEAPAGPATLRIVFQAPLTEVPESLYRVKDRDQWYAFSQFEPLEARAAFPCFDQPEFKVPWEITLRVPTGQRAFSNAAEVSRSLEAGMQVVRFAKTPPLPTYLIAFAVGPLDVLEAPAGAAPGSGPPLRIITTAGRSSEAAYALEHTPRILASLERWFGLPYPYSKLDLVAVPNFSSGAMENAGLVTFRERLLLLDARSPSGARAGMFGVIAHELAHMWFGDLVTMVWWDDLWLNEAFATWMATRTVQEVAPEFEADIDSAANAGGIHSQDAQPSTRSIRQPITHGGDVYNAFDGITYGKGALVLGMIEAWLSPEVFRKGVHDYLVAHSHGSARTADLVSALAAASGAPVEKVIDSFTTRPGSPLVDVEVECPAGGPPRLALKQARYRPQDGQAPEVTPWTLPMCVRYPSGPATGSGAGADAGGAPPVKQCFAFEGAQAAVALTGTKTCPAWLHPNADERGYYRWALPAAQRKALLVTARDQLTLRERVAIPSLTGAWLEAGRLPVDEALEVYLALGSETHRTLLSGAIWGLRGPFRHLGEVADPRLTKRIVQAFGAHLDRLGLESKAGEGPEIRFLRSSLVMAMADMTEDARILERARTVAAAFVRDPAGVDPEEASMYVQMAAHRGDLALWSALRDLLKRPTPLSASARETVVRALGSFRDPALLKRSLSATLDDTLRAQDLRTILGGAGGRDISRQTAWDWLTEHYDAVVARVGDKASPAMPFVGASFCDEAHRQAVSAFFAGSRGAPQGTERNLRLTLESIDRCIANARRHGQTAREWLNRQAP